MDGEYGSELFNASYFRAFYGNSDRSAASVNDLAPIFRKQRAARAISPILEAIPEELIATEANAVTSVYFLAAGEKIKIGISVNIDKRIKALQTGTPDKIEVLFTITGGRRLEKYFHGRFAAEWLGGEWFSYRGAIKAFLSGNQNRK
jgi:hypothetical protein